MHVLVAACAGFIGSHLVDSLLRDGCEITVVDNFDFSYEQSSQGVRPQVGDVPRTWATVEKARALLGYRAEVSYPEGVSRFVDWYSSRRCFTA